MLCEVFFFTIPRQPMQVMRPAKKVASFKPIIAGERYLVR
jgi:hypothetical protein